MRYRIKATDHFQKELKRLAKKYKKMKQDYAKLLDALEEDPKIGTSLGDDCYKIRMPNSSIPTGKSGGFRVITLVRVCKETVVLLTVYSKTDKANISDSEIVAILKELKG